MILNPQAKTILCFWSSSTWWYEADVVRFERGERWTYQLQELLWNDFEIIEEGLRSRTTGLDDPKNDGRNGMVYFKPCFESYEPDILILWLWTNDTKAVFHSKATDIFDRLKSMISFAENVATQRKFQTRIILVAPPKISLNHLRDDTAFNDQSDAILRELSEMISASGFENVNLYEKFSGWKKDGIHLSHEDNTEIAHIFYEKILTP